MERPCFTITGLHAFCVGHVVPANVAIGVAAKKATKEL